MKEQAQFEERFIGSKSTGEIHQQILGKALGLKAPKVAFEAIRVEMMLAELSKKYGVHPTRIRALTMRIVPGYEKTLAHAFHMCSTDERRTILRSIQIDCVQVKHLPPVTDYKINRIDDPLKSKNTP